MTYESYKKIIETGQFELEGTKKLNDNYSLIELSWKEKSVHAEQISIERDILKFHLKFTYKFDMDSFQKIYIKRFSDDITYSNEKIINGIAHDFFNVDKMILESNYENLADHLHEFMYEKRGYLAGKKFGF